MIETYKLECDNQISIWQRDTVTKLERCLYENSLNNGDETCCPEWTDIKEIDNTPLTEIDSAKLITEEEAFLEML